jgi:hypothetical protein
MAAALFQAEEAVARTPAEVAAVCRPTEAEEARIPEEEAAVCTPAEGEEAVRTPAEAVVEARIPEAAAGEVAVAAVYTPAGLPVGNHKADRAGTLTGAKAVNRGQTAVEPVSFRIRVGPEAGASSICLPLPADRGRDWLVPPAREVPAARVRVPAQIRDRVRTQIRAQA